MSQGLIYLHRKLFEWEWYTDINTKTLFIHILLKANFKNKKWRGIDIKRGQLLTSYSNLANETGLTVQQVRTSIKKLEKTQEVTNKTTNKYSLLTIEKYDDYQNKDETATSKTTGNQQSNNKQVTINQQTSNKQVTTTNNVNNDSIMSNKENNDNKKENIFPANFKEQSDILKNKIVEFVEYRKQIKHPFRTYRPIKRLIDEIGKEFKSEEHLIQCLDKTMEMEWRGVKGEYVEYKEEKKERNYDWLNPEKEFRM